MSRNWPTPAGVFCTPSRLRDALVRGRLTREAVFDLARQDRLTGSVTFHFRDGKPLTVAMGSPLQTELVEEDAREDTLPRTVHA